MVSQNCNVPDSWKTPGNNRGYIIIRISKVNVHQPCVGVKILHEDDQKIYTDHSFCVCVMRMHANYVHAKAAKWCSHYAVSYVHSDCSVKSHQYEMVTL